MDEYKTCTKCGQTKPRTNEFFYRNKNSPDGLRPDCASCGKSRSREYSRNHAEQNRLRVKNWRLSEPEKAKATKSQYYLRNRESIRAKWQAEYKSDPAKFQVSKRRRRAREHDVVTESYTWKDVVKKWGNKCHICGDEIDLEANRRPGLSGWENGLHLDHVIPIRLLGADTLENVKPAHGICNLRKH